ncbi:DUF2147 domain-containing protein [Gramella sp. KN1008]|uniref:DUF2147 domain-containing protein n=1 Tax=Gramella sp. KN1008 TaxID=2529298 RepID=UPI00103D0E47|nr:DUF2147 domain-containing protein [Gramella sp. KN1008]TBW27894.1 DUF2147 domain-containing protein [Gramella sp. KN1008]
MKQTIKKILITGLLIFIGLPAVAQKGKNAILGVWYNSENTAKVKIYRCQDERNEFCGKIIWLEDPRDASGKPRLDIENSEEDLQSRALMGMRIMSGFEYEGDNEWEDGELYDPEKGKTYACNMELQENGNLKIVGYIGFSIMGRTMTWTRAE